MASSRDALEKRFRDGARPSQADFKEFIASGINIADDGIGFMKDGIKLSKRTVYPANGTAFKIEFGDDTINSLEVHHAQDNPVLGTSPLLSISDAGLSVTGIAVNGVVSMNTRRGSFTQTNVLKAPANDPADPNDIWQTILHTAKDCQAYEIVAQLEDGVTNPKFASTKCMLVAYASTSQSPVTNENEERQSDIELLWDKLETYVKGIFGITNHKIKVIQSYSAWGKNRIRLKWVENYDSYSLQVKADSGKVYYAITQLWGPDFIAQNSDFLSFKG